MPVNIEGRLFIVKKLAKNKWQAQYSNGSTKVFKTLKAAKASISRTFKTLVQKKYLRKIDILDYENFKIGIGFNLT